MTESIRSEVDAVEVALSNDPAAVLVEVDGAIVVARIDANTSKRSIKRALLEVNAQLERAINFRSGLVDASEEEKQLVTDGGTALDRETLETRTHPSKMANPCIFREIAELVTYHNEPGFADAVDDRFRKIYHVLEDRLDVEFPECPDCGAELRRDEYGGVTCFNYCGERVPEKVVEEYERQDRRLWGLQGHGELQPRSKAQ